MQIIVLVKQVPDTTEVRLDPKTGNLIREGVKSIVNPDDRNAVEAAVSLKEKYGAKITVLSMGPPQAIDAVSEALGMGADKGILLSDRAFAGADTWATSGTLGKAIKKLGDFDLIIAGRQAIDGDTAQIGPQVAEYLDVTQATYVCGIDEVRPDAIVVKRRLEDGIERLELRLPALLTVVGELNRPRYPFVGRLLDACREKAPIEVWNAADLGFKTADVGLEGSLTHVVRTFSPKSKRQSEMLEGSARDAAASLIGKILNKKLLRETV
ncbi:MAG: electron transfer flavoprotein subunit beta/FixA family protein [Desulfobacteraceae bacterium]|nr:MAG: electron transfer flavoprotein subunit beta/FixA family protein [Desulfobacteraceae bacterium]